MAFFFLFNTLCAKEEAVFITLGGFLNRESLLQAKTSLDRLSQSSRPLPPLVMEIDSTGGDLGQVLDVAKTLYELKKLKDLRVTVYIRDNALGPAAILPFLADELDSSLSISWGDIPLGTEGALPANIIRNRVRGLIDSQSPRAPLLYVLADAMSDPSLQVVNGQGWKIAAANKEGKAQMISSPGQTLVVNQNQLLELGLLKEVLTPARFEAKYGVEMKVLPVSGGNGASLQLSPASVQKETGRAHPL